MLFIGNISILAILLFLIVLWIAFGIPGVAGFTVVALFVFMHGR